MATNHQGAETMTDAKQNNTSALQEVYSQAMNELHRAQAQARRLEQSACQRTGTDLLRKNTARRIEQMQQTMRGVSQLLGEAMMPAEDRLIQP
jgi:hypothetical protein